MTIINSQTQTNAKTNLWTVQRENFHWIYKNLRAGNFLNLPCMVEDMQSRITMHLSRGKLTVKVGIDGKTAFAYENGTVAQSTEPRFVPSRDVVRLVRNFLGSLARRSLRY